jgi:hypothetical protein
MKLINTVLVTVLLLQLTLNCQGNKTPKSTPVFGVTVDKDPNFPMFPRISFENYYFKAVIRSEVSEEGLIENGFCDWIIQSTQHDEINYMVDGCAMRPAIAKVEKIKESATEITVKITYEANSFVQLFTVFSNQPYIKVDYLKYSELNGNNWMNTVDVTEKTSGDNRNYQTHLAGDSAYIRPKVLYEDVYWNSSEWDIPKAGADPKDGGSLNYRNNAIMVVSNKKTGAGFGRVMPFWKENESGGMRVLKLLWNRGFETFPALGKNQHYCPAFTAYLYCFDKGFKNGISIGKKLLDSLPKTKLLTEIETDLFKVSYGNTPDFWGSGITRFIYKPHAANYGCTLDAYGWGHAKYAEGLPVNSSISFLNAQITEIKHEFNDSITIVKYDRFYKNYPVMEIHYEKFNALWWEDFYNIEDSSAVLSLYNHTPLNRSQWQERRAIAEKKCDHNFGDCFLTANNEHIKNYLYKGFFIYGTHAKKSGKGIGGIFLNSVPIHDSWKPWWDDRKVPNVESFPIGRSCFSRWLFIYENGGPGMDKTARKIIDDLIITGKLYKRAS